MKAYLMTIACGIIGCYSLLAEIDLLPFYAWLIPFNVLALAGILVCICPSDTYIREISERIVCRKGWVSCGQIRRKSAPIQKVLWLPIAIFAWPGCFGHICGISHLFQ